MEFGRAFTFAFQDPDWLKKAGLAAVILLIPVIGQIVVLGWALEITRRVINHESDLLPGWEDFSAYLPKGFQAFVIGLAYALPLILLAICNQVVTFGLIAASSSSSSNSNTLGTLAPIVTGCFSCLILIFGIAAGLLIPPAMGKLAETGELGAAFRFNEIFGLLRAAPGPFLLVLIGDGLAYTILAPIGLVICGVGLLAVIAYIQMLNAHLTGQAYLVAKANAQGV